MGKIIKIKKRDTIDTGIDGVRVYPLSNSDLQNKRLKQIVKKMQKIKPFSKVNKKSLETKNANWIIKPKQLKTNVDIIRYMVKNCVIKDNLNCLPYQKPATGILVVGKYVYASDSVCLVICKNDVINGWGNDGLYLPVDNSELKQGKYKTLCNDNRIDVDKVVNDYTGMFNRRNSMDIICVDKFKIKDILRGLFRSKICSNAYKKYRVGIYKNPDGSLGYVSRDDLNMVEINMFYSDGSMKNGHLLFSINANLMIKMLRFHQAMGNSEVYMSYIQGVNPVFLQGDNNKSITIQMILGD